VRAAVKIARAKGTRIALPVPQCRGLVLRVTPTGHQSWAFTYRRKLDLKSRWLTLGTYPDVSMKDACDKADKARGRVADGKDPVAERKHARTQAQAAKTFDQLARAFVEHLRDKGKKSWRNYWRVLVGGPLPDAKRVVKRTKKNPAVPLSKMWSDKTLGEITRADVRDAVLSVARRAPVHANRVFAYTRQAFNFALERDWLEHSPCAAIKAPTEERTRTRVLDDDEIRRLWKALDNEPQVIADVVRVLLLTGQRSGEVFRMRWTELDAEGWWTLPETRTKNGLPHRVYLTKPVREILERRHSKDRKSEWVFRSPKRLNDPIGSIAKAIARLRRATGIDFRPHDLRRTASTVMPRAGVPELTIPKILNHIPPGVTRKHYNLFGYDAEKKLGWELWAKEVDRILKATGERKSAGTVVPFFARA
jgi:integrase